MRQDHTLRVILNTAVIPAMSFTHNQKLKSSYILFTAFDNGAPMQVQMKASLALRFLFPYCLVFVDMEPTHLTCLC